MNTTRSCGCKGCRSCLLCETAYGIDKQTFIRKDLVSYVYCPLCNKAYEEWDINTWNQHPNHPQKSIDYPGVYIKLDFITEEEESKLVKEIDGEPWDPSQSGRRKQNYGPKCNFKKHKLRIGDFNGFPKFSKFIQDRFKDYSILQDFQTIEQCSLEYDPTKGASIDPHIDDCWIWGERIISVNLLADSVLTMTINQNTERYNLDCVETYPSILSEKGEKPYTLQNNQDVLIKIPMPRRSLLVLYGSARYDWEHQILREDIKERRICLAYREFTPPYLIGDNVDSLEVIKKAKEFW